MRFGSLVFFLGFLSVAACSANTLLDTFNQPQNNCNYSSVSPYSACDVMGDPQLFDIQSLSLSDNGSLGNLLIYLNSGAVQRVDGELTLTPFSDSGLTLIPGDVFFYNINSVYDPSDPATAQYLEFGLALTSHGNFQAGSIYSIGGGVSVETAQQALNDTSDYYRRDEAVLMTGIGVPVTSGTVTVADYGNGTTDARYVVSVTFPETSGLLALESNGQIGVLFSAADCGNDVIQGAVSPTPEPGPAALVLAGVALLFAGKWRKRLA